jgi:alpha-tubulin suppressor-like RCC1 family protein
VLPLPGALGPVVSVAVGYNHTCVCDSSGQAWCWGSNSDGQLGTGDTKNQSKPTLVEGISDCVQIAAGGFHTCVKRKAGNGTVTCWGRNAEGQIGTAVSTTPVTRPKDVAGLNAVVEVHCGEKFTCTRTTASAVMCWGDNSQGQLGDGTTTTRDVPARVVNIPTSPSPAGEVATGRFFACARMTSGEVWCWGANLKGAYGTTSPVKSPVQLPNLEKVTQVAAGHDHACFLQVSGAVSCVGSNQYGQLGDGTGLNAIVPVPVLDIPSDATSISAGTVHSCARRSTGTVCWGQNILGQLGDGSTADELRPVAVVGF